MKLNLNMPFHKEPKNANGEDIKGPALARLVLLRIIDAKYQQKAMPNNESRMWGKILDEFADEKDVIEIDGSQFDFLKDAVDKTDMPPAFSSWLWVVREYFETVKAEEKNRKESEKLRAIPRSKE